jgi:hypothetical protein
VVRYESLLRHTAGEVKKILEFGGVPRSEQEIRNAVAESTFEKMKTMEQEKGLGYVEPGDKGIAFVRQGGSGNWRTSFGEAEKRVFKDRFGKALIKAGYESSMLW